MRVAAIDVGSNSIHMIVAEVLGDGQFHVVDRAKVMVRLGRRSLTTGRLPKSAIDQGVRTLAAFRTLAERLGATKIRAVATSAVREAVNGGDFVQRVHDEVRLRLKVVPGREEARLVYLGVAHSVDLRGEPTLIADVGGGSVELILTRDGEPVSIRSLKIGVARLTESFVISDPPTVAEIRALEAHVDDSIRDVATEARTQGVRRVIATSGTLLNLVAMASHAIGNASEERLHGLAVPAGSIADVRRTLRGASREERSRMKGIDAKRADLVVAGACIAHRILKQSGATEVVACTWALREGLLIDYVARHARGIEEGNRYEDVRRRSVARLLRRHGADGAHHEQVARLSLRIFDQLRSRLDLAGESREWLEYAALLHDIGHVIDHTQHHRHSYYLITNAELMGFSRREIEIVAQVALHHHRKIVPKMADMSARLGRGDLRTVRALSAILRVAEGLDRSHYGVVRDVTVGTRGDRIHLGLRTDGDEAALEVWEAQRRIPLLGKVLGADVVLKVDGRGEGRRSNRAEARAVRTTG